MCLKHRYVEGSGPEGFHGSGAGMLSAQRLALPVGQDLLLLSGPFILCQKIPSCNRCPDIRLVLKDSVATLVNISDKILY